MPKTIRKFWGPCQGRVPLNFNWPAINHDSVVLITAAEYKTANPPSNQHRFIGSASITVENIAPHGPPFDPNHGVGFVVNVDWHTALPIVTDIILLDNPPIEIQTYVPPTPTPDSSPDHLDFQTGTITFKNGVPVGGWAQIRLYKNGNWEFSGHFRDSGMPSYDAGIGLVIVASDGTAFTFGEKVHLNGTLESGSRDGDWNKNGHNDLIAKHWTALCADHHWQWQANVNWDWGILVKQIQDGMKIAGTIISTVVTIVALV